MKLYCFGDSYTEGYKNDMSFWPYDAYRKFLGAHHPSDMPPLWPERLGELLDVETENLGKGGLSNQEIFFRISEHSHRFQKDDIVIINWTYIQRCMWVVDEKVPNDYTNHMMSISPHQGKWYDRNGLYKKTWDAIAVNRTHPSWTYEIKRYSEIIDTLSKTIGFKVYYWFTDDYLFRNYSKIANVNTDEFLLHDLIEKYDRSKDNIGFCCIPFNIFGHNGGKTIRQDSNGIADDSMHLGGTGHRVQADFFYSYLTNTPYPSKII